MHADDRHGCRQQWKDAFERGVGFAGQYRLKRFDGEYRYFLWRTVPLRDVKGNIINWFGEYNGSWCVGQAEFRMEIMSFTD
jgi:PAS domain-containing protein